MILLVDQGKINLNDTLGVFFNKVPADKQSITINDLLSHKSGFQQNYVCDGIANTNKALLAILKDKLVSKPGTKFNYSNQNYQLLGLIIEKVTKITYEEFTRANILHPLGMTNTCFWDEIKNYRNVAGTNEKLSKRYTKRN